MQYILIFPSFFRFKASKQNQICKELKQWIHHDDIALYLNRVSPEQLEKYKWLQNCPCEVHWIHPLKHPLDWKEKQQLIFQTPTEAFHILGGLWIWRRCKNLARGKASAPLLWWTGNAKKRSSNPSLRI